MVMYPGTMSIDEVREELGLGPSAKFSCYTSPEKSYYPTDTAIRMDETLTKVYTPDGRRLHHVREYQVHDGSLFGCVYVEFRDDDNHYHHIIGRDQEDLEYNLNQHTKPNQNQSPQDNGMGYGFSMRV